MEILKKENYVHSISIIREENKMVVDIDNQDFNAQLNDVEAMRSLFIKIIGNKVCVF